MSVVALGGSLDSGKSQAGKALTANDGSGNTTGAYADSQTQQPGTQQLLGGYSSAKQNGSDANPDNTQLAGQSTGDAQNIFATNLPQSQVSSAGADLTQVRRPGPAW